MNVAPLGKDLPCLNRAILLISFVSNVALEEGEQLRHNYDTLKAVSSRCSPFGSPAPRQEVPPPVTLCKTKTTK